jgi:hypothetical protein
VSVRLTSRSPFTREGSATGHGAAGRPPRGSPRPLGRRVTATTVSLTVETCYLCGVPFGMPDYMMAKRREDGRNVKAEDISAVADRDRAAAEVGAQLTCRRVPSPPEAIVPGGDHARPSARPDARRVAGGVAPAATLLRNLCCHSPASTDYVPAARGERPGERPPSPATSAARQSCGRTAPAGRCRCAPATPRGRSTSTTVRRSTRCTRATLEPAGLPPGRARAPSGQGALRGPLRLGQDAVRHVRHGHADPALRRGPVRARGRAVRPQDAARG